MIFDKRLSEWAKQHGLHVKGQVGFCKDYHTIDQFFRLRILIKQGKAKIKGILLLLCGLHKRFDMVPREMLWQVLVGFGVEGRFL
jgi:hypothetical protein